MDASLDHLLRVLGLWALADGLTVGDRNLHLLGVTVVEADRLVEGYWLLVLILNFNVHAAMLEAVVPHLVP